jgi:hypothetical protein
MLPLSVGHGKAPVLQERHQHRLRRHELREDQHLQQRVVLLLLQPVDQLDQSLGLGIGALALGVPSQLEQSIHFGLFPLPAAHLHRDPPVLPIELSPLIDVGVVEECSLGCGSLQHRLPLSSVVRIAAVLEVTSRCIRIIRKPM